MAVEYADAWQKNDPKLNADVARIWAAPGVLPADANVDERIKQISVIAYDDGVPVGVSMVNVQIFAQLRQKFVFYREDILPEFRTRPVGEDLAQETYNRVEAYALAHLDEKLAGMIAVVLLPNVGDRPREKKIPMTLIGYTNANQQVRLKWFQHFRVPLNMTDF